MLCITGLPLIFHDEIDALLNTDTWSPSNPNAEHLTLDEILAIGLAYRPSEIPVYLSFDIERPVVNLTSASIEDSTNKNTHFASYDLTSGNIVPPRDRGEPVMKFILQMHTDMFLGLTGMLFLGLMGGFFIVATISGVVLYRQYMRNMDFGEVRHNRSRRHRWLDHHNLLGVVTFAWVLVVGATGVINTLEKPILDAWKSNNLSDLLSSTKYLADGAEQTQFASIGVAVKQAQALLPEMVLQFVGFPGSAFSTEQHYAIFMHGDTPLTREIIIPVLVDAYSGEVVGVSHMPWYVDALSLSRPLHFGDYAGLPLKIVWCIMTLFTMWILITGLYLWWRKYGR
tara:strand:- start:5872 stop:6894 length:1023 start_codon:yes stop_codon:yes gene_type:complete